MLAYDLNNRRKNMNIDNFISFYAKVFVNQNRFHLKNGRQTLKREVHENDIRKHLYGESRLGVFPITNLTNTQMFVFDIDNQCKDTSRKIIYQLKIDGFNSYLEKSKSKGFHVWVFLEREQKAKDVRNYMKHVLEVNNISNNKIDLFPKQDELTELAPCGNGINLPMFGILNNPQTHATLFLDNDFNLIDDQLTYFLSIKKSDFKINQTITSFTTNNIYSIEEHTNIDERHETETLQKLIQVGRKTRSVRDSVIKAKKETRSEKDTVYAKHLAELLFSPALIEKELSLVSNKLNDPSLRGKPKLNYLEDKKRQFSYLRALLNNNLANNEPDNKKFAPIFKIVDEDSDPLLITKKIMVKKFGKIDEKLLDWMEVNFHHIAPNDYYAISTGCGGGKSNVIKQLCLSIWAYNKEKCLPNVNTLVSVERIEDGVYLEKITNALRPLKLSSKNDRVFDMIDNVTIQQINDYAETLHSSNLLKSIDENLIFTIDEGKKLRLKRGNCSIPYTDMVFKCAPSEKICLNGHTESDFNKNVCSQCSKLLCPAHPSKQELIQKSSIAISTHQALMKSNEWGPIRVDAQRKQRQLLLIDEKPEALKCVTLFLGKNGNLYKSSIDSLVSYLKETEKTELYSELNDVFLRKIKEIYSKAKTTHKKLNSGDQSYDIYKSYTVPVISIKGRNRLNTLKQDIWSNSGDIEQKKHLSELIDTVLLMNGKDDSIITFGKRGSDYELRLEIVVNQWSKIIPNENSATILFDATANIDPSYLTEGAPRIENFSSMPDVDFSNLNLIFFSEKDVSKEKVTKTHCDKLFGYLADHHPEYKKLIVHSKEKMNVVQNAISDVSDSDLFYTDHFNNLKGKNTYIDCNVIAFTNLLRRTEANYLLIAQEIYKFQSKKLNTEYRPDISTSWSLKRGVGQLTNLSDATFVFNDPFLDNVRTGVDVVDIVQTIFRISLRRDYNSTNYVYLPIASSGLLKKIIHYFKGAKVSRINI